MLLPLTNLGHKLRAKYRVPITLLILACLAASWVPTILFAFWLARLMQIPAGVPVKDLPDGPLWATLFLVFAVGSMMVGYLSGFIVLAAVLRWRAGWSTERIRRLMLHSEIPTRWLKSHETPNPAVQRTDLGE